MTPSSFARCALVGLVSALAACAQQAPVAPKLAQPAPVMTASASPVVAEVAPAPPPPASFALRGRLLGYDGAPMKLAHVHVAGRTIAVDPGGAFRVENLPRGFVLVHFTGVGHEDRSVGLFVDGHEQDIEVTLGTVTRGPAWLQHPVLIQHRRADDGTTPVTSRTLMKPRNGVLAADVTRVTPSGDLLYQVAGLFEGQPTEGTEADAFLYDGANAYLSVLHVDPKRPKRRRIELDPRLLPPVGKVFALRFAEPDQPAARIATLHLAAMRRLEDDAAGRPVDGGFRADLVRALATPHDASDADVSAALRFAYLIPPPAPGPEAATVAAALLDALPPDAARWRFHVETAVVAVELAGFTPARSAYLDQLFDALDAPDAAREDAAASFLAARIRAATHAGRDDEVARLYPVMRARFSGTPASRSVALFDPARKVRPGQEIPDFDLVAMSALPGQPPTHVTRASLRGKVALVDFWGTWCVPCRAEVPHLEATYARHHAEGFTIVSIAANDRADHVRAFRRAISPMPWTHVVLERDDPADVLERFETHAFPTPFLVDGAGRILAAGEELRGAALERAVASALASARRP